MGKINPKITKIYKSMGLWPARSAQSFWSKLESTFPGRVETVVKLIDERIDAVDNRGIEPLYDEIHRDIDFANAFHGQFDAERLARLLEWILNEGWDAQQPMVILDIGCGGGILCCALAKLYPALQIVGIDEHADSIRIAQQRAERLGVSNTRFLEASPEDVLSGGTKFDVIITCSSASEIADNEYEGNFYRVNDSDTWETPAMLESIREEVSMRQDRFELAATIKHLLKPQGMYLAYERLTHPKAVQAFVSEFHREKIGACLGKSTFLTHTNMSGSPEKIPLLIMSDVMTHEADPEDVITFFEHETFCPLLKNDVRGRAATILSRAFPGETFISLWPDGSCEESPVRVEISAHGGLASILLKAHEDETIFEILPLTVVFERWSSILDFVRFKGGSNGPINYTVHNRALFARSELYIHVTSELIEKA